MNLDIDNSKMYTKPDQICPRCGMKLNLGMVFHNTPANCKERKTYIYMEIGQSMHAECYIEQVIDLYWKQKKEQEVK